MIDSNEAGHDESLLHRDQKNLYICVLYDSLFPYSSSFLPNYLTTDLYTCSYTKYKASSLQCNNKPYDTYDIFELF